MDYFWTSVLHATQEKPLNCALVWDSEGSGVVYAGSSPAGGTLLLDQEGAGGRLIQSTRVLADAEVGFWCNATEKETAR
jgi:hypothetical protein